MFTTKRPLSFEEIRTRVLAKKELDLLVREVRQISKGGLL